MTRNIIGSIKLEPDASAPTAAKGVMYFDSGTDKLKISEDGATFVELGAGGGQSPYDAIVAAGGGEDYTTLGAAITAGHKYILIKDGTTTETGEITLPSYTKLVGESHNANIGMATYNINIGVSCVVQDLKMTSNSVGGQVILTGDGSILQNCYFINGTTSNPGARVGMIDDSATSRRNIRIDNCFFLVSQTGTDMDNRQAINQQASGSSAWIITNCQFYGNSTTARISGVRMVGTENNLSNLFFEDFGEANDSLISCSGTQNTINGVTVRTSLGRITLSANDCVLTGVATDDVIHTYVDGDGCIVGNCQTGGNLQVGSGANNCSAANSNFESGVAILGDLTTLSGIRAGVEAGGGAATISFAAGADNNIVIGCKTDAAISDGGTGNILTSNQVY